MVVDVDHQIWQEYENIGWPARYLWTGDQFLFDFHYGEGAYAETELAIQELLGVERDTVAPIRPEDEPGAVLVPQSQDMPGPYSGPYEAGGVWGVFSGSGVATVNGVAIEIRHPGAYELIVHTHHTEGVLELDVSDELCVLAVCFTPGLAGPGVSLAGYAHRSRRSARRLGWSREGDPDRQPPAGPRLSVDLGVVRLGDRAHDREPEAVLPQLAAPVRAGPSRRNGSNIVSISSGAIICPLLSTTSSARSPCWRVLISTWPPSTLCRTALSTRFEMRRSIRAASPSVMAASRRESRVIWCLVQLRDVVVRTIVCMASAPMIGSARDARARAHCWRASAAPRSAAPGRGR